MKSKPSLLRLNTDEAVSLNRQSYLVFISLAGLYTAARLWRLTDSCLWFDEIFSVHAARYGWGRMMGFVAADLIHPPLFYALLKVWIGIGDDSLLWLRLFPALTAIAALIPFFLLCRELRLTATEMNVALLLMAVNGYLIKYAQEVRMYSLLLLLTLCSLWLFVRFFNRSERSQPRLLLLALFLVNLLLVYTHYYGWLVVVVEAAFLLWRGRRQLPSFLITVALLLVCFSPWVYIVIAASRQGRGLEQNIGWVTRPRPGDVAQYLTLLSEPFYFRQSSNEPLYHGLSAALALLIFGLPLLALIWRIFSRRGVDDGARIDALRWLLLVCFLPLALALSLSWILPQSIWGARHLIIVAAPYSILAAIALLRLRPYWLKVTVFLLLSCWLFVAGAVLLLLRQERYIWCAWDELAQQAAQAEPGAAIKLYAFEDLIAYHLWFSLKETTGVERFKVAVIKGIPELREDPAYFLPRRFDDIAVGDPSALSEENIWVAFRDTSWNEDRQPLKTLEGRGYQVNKVLETTAQGQKAFLVRLSRR